MKILCIGGGPAGLYFGLLMKLKNPGNEVVVVERNRPYDTFGWGVVFSDATLENLRIADPVSAEAIAAAFQHWDDIKIHFRDRTVTSGGHGFVGIDRRKLLNILQARCEQIGVQLVFETLVVDDQELARQYDADLVVASDGINSQVRSRYVETYRPDIDQRNCRFVWLGTQKVFDAFTFIFVPTEHGWFQAHAYQFENGLSTFIVETTEATWRAAGIDTMSQEEGIAYCERVFAAYLDGEPLISNATHQRGSAIWIRFPRVICERWVHWTQPRGERERRVPVVLMGDAAHTAHFSIGSGTKLALEDAIELCNSLTPQEDLQAMLARYEEVRAVAVHRIQNAARNSTEWFENVDRYAWMEPQQFAYSLLTRSQRISHENLRLRDRRWLEDYERWLAARAGSRVAADERPPLPLFTPLRVAAVPLKNRVVVSPTLLYGCQEGMPGIVQRDHLGACARGGAGLVLTEATAISADGRVTSTDPGLWNVEQAAAWKAVTDVVHAQKGTLVGVQLNHAGRRGASSVSGQDGTCSGVEAGSRLVAASALAYQPGITPVPEVLTREGMSRIKQQFVEAALRAIRAGFDWLELQAGHGYLLSGFISPLTNQRTDEYGGSLENRLRFPLEVLAAIRGVWPAHRPLSVRISASDWAMGGTGADEAVEIARRLRLAGADIVDVSSGEVVAEQKPVYGRMYQTPFADRIRNEAQVPTLAVGAITDADQVNGIIASGRADLCALSRSYLSDPDWLPHECARLGWSAM